MKPFNFLFILILFFIIYCKTLNFNQLHQWIYQCPDQDPEIAYLFDKSTVINTARKETLPSGSIKTIGVNNYFDEFYQYLLSDLGKNQIPYKESNHTIELQDFLIRKIKDQNGNTIGIQVVSRSQSIFDKKNTQTTNINQKAIESLTRALRQFEDAGIEIYKYYDNPSNKNSELQNAFSMQLILNNQYNIPSEKILKVDTKDYNQNPEKAQISLLQYPQKLELIILPKDRIAPQLEEPLPIGNLTKLGDEEYLEKMYEDFKNRLKKNQIEFEEKNGILKTNDIIIKKIRSPENNRLLAILIYIRTEPIFGSFFTSKESLNNYGEKLLNIAGKTIKIFQESNLYFYGRTYDYEKKELLKSRTQNVKKYLNTNYQIPNHRFLITKTIVSKMNDNPFGPKTEILHFYLFTLPVSYLVDYLPEEIRELKKGLASKIGSDKYLDLMFSQIVEDLKERGINIQRKDSEINPLDDRYEAFGFFMGKIKKKKKTKIIKISFDGDFSFALGSANITEKAKKVIEAMAKALNEYPDATVRIHGHTDSTGSKQFNYKLSQDRAEAVKNELINSHKIEAKRFIEVKGFADDRKIEDTMGPSAKNRRVEILIEVPDQEQEIENQE